MSGVAEGTDLIERTRLGIDKPMLVAAGRSTLQRVIVNAPGEVRVYDAQSAEDVTVSNLIYFDARQGISDVLAINCTRGIFVQPVAGAVVALHFWGLL